MSEGLFHIFNAITSVGCLLLGWGVFFHGRRFGSDVLLLRRFVAAVFTSFACHQCSLGSILHPEGVEVFASKPLGLLCVSLIILCMGGTAIMGRKHHCNLALWVLMLATPVAFLQLNLVMMASGNYHPLFHWSELIGFRHSQPVFYYGRLVFVLFQLLFWLLSAGMLVDAFVFDCRQRAATPLSDDAERHRVELRFILLWAGLMIAGLVPMLFNSLLLYIIYSILVIVALIATAWGYYRLVRYLRARADGRLASVLIVRRLPKLLTMEQGGTTEWGVVLLCNPFFCGNPSLDNVAQALGVENSDLSDFLTKQGVNLVAWVSDQRLRHCAQQLSTTQRKISEIADSCGYHDLPTFTRAFKRQFGMAPSTYREKNHD
ncbi:helix-turn-helix transcriptional regulator [Prevotella sp. MA2016]|uniref:helix-turn-helix transcriptional regulator n=1 Tax=Prevotella sp. MA2016 TaxID=1408310 RepID=UPI000563320D|nr:helix-turn-helix transcriptional regulator [Prevotella sp. MA2016]